MLLTGALAVLLTASGCSDLTKIEPVTDPNNPIIRKFKEYVRNIRVGVSGNKGAMTRRFQFLAPLPTQPK